MRHRCADADRREHHHVVRKLEHDLRQTFHRAHDRLTFFANSGNRERKQHAERDNLQNVAAHHRVDDARRKNVDDCLDQTLGVRFSDRFDDVDLAGSQSDARARFREIDNRESDE